MCVVCLCLSQWWEGSHFFAVSSAALSHCAIRPENRPPDNNNYEEYDETDRPPLTTTVHFIRPDWCMLTLESKTRLGGTLLWPPWVSLASTWHDTMQLQLLTPLSYSSLITWDKSRCLRLDDQSSPSWLRPKDKTVPLSFARIAMRSLKITSSSSVHFTERSIKLIQGHRGCGTLKMMIAKTLLF